MSPETYEIRQPTELTLITCIKNDNADIKPANCHHFCLITDKRADKTLQTTFLLFRKIGNGMESEHLRKRKNEDKQAVIAKIKAMRSAGATLREIADELGMTIPTVDRWSKL